MAERRRDHDLFSDVIPEASPSVLDGGDDLGVDGNQATADQTGSEDAEQANDEALAYVVCQPPESGADTVQLELYPGMNDELVLLAYSSVENLTAGAGDSQPWVAVPVSMLEHVRTEAGADRVAWDADLPSEWRPHDGSTGVRADGEDG